MISDRELFTQALEDYATKTVGDLFGFKSIAAQTLTRYGVRNMVDKYSDLLGFLTDSSGKMNIDLIMDALKSEVKARGGIKIWNIKLTDSDFTEITSIYNRLKDGCQGTNQ